MASMNQSKLLGDHDIDVSFNIESMVACSGTCAGCILTVGEKRSQGIWTLDVHNKVKDLVFRRVGHFLDGGYNPDFEINFGQGNHLLLSNRELFSLLDFAKEVTRGDGFVEFSVAALQPPNIIIEKLTALKRRSIEIQFPATVNIVLDIRRLMNERMTSSYQESLKAILSIFPEADIVFNLGPDVQSIPPRLIHEILHHGGFQHFTLNLLPTTLNSQSYLNVWRPIVDWVIALVDEWSAEKTYQLAFQDVFRTANDVFQTVDYESPPDSKMLWEKLQERFSREVYIDNHGMVSISTMGIGEGLSFQERFGSQAIDLTDIHDIDSHARKNAIQSISSLSRHAACSSCTYSHICMAMGRSVLMNVFGNSSKKSSSCPLLLQDIFRRLSETLSWKSNIPSRHPLIRKRAAGVPYRDFNPNLVINHMGGKGE